MSRLSSNPFFAACCGSKALDISKLHKRRVATVSSPKTVTFSHARKAAPTSSPSKDVNSISLIVSGANLHDFSLEDLSHITNGFSANNFIGKGGFGPVFKGFIHQRLQVWELSVQRVAVKLLDPEGLQGHKEWLAEVRFLGKLRHPNLVKLIGYCCENEHRLLVYEFIPNGSLQDHLFNNVMTPLPWFNRLKIAVAAAKGLCFLHEAEKPIIHRDFKPSNILLDNDYVAKLSDFGLAKDGPQGDDTHVSTRVMGTSGYAAPEYIMTGHITTKSDVYSFGVVLLELLTGRRSVDKTRRSKERDLVEWAKRYLRDPQMLYRIMDPGLEEYYSTIGAQKAAALAYQCLSRNPKRRPDMKTAVKTLEPLLDLRDIPMNPCVCIVMVEDSEVGMKVRPYGL